MHLGDCLCVFKLLPTMIEETQVQAVFYSCLKHPVYEKVRCIVSEKLMLSVFTCVYDYSIVTTKSCLSTRQIPTQQ